MEIFPVDLGPEWQVALIQARMLASSAPGSRRGPRTSVTAGDTGTRFGALGRFWTGGAGLPDGRADDVLRSMGGVIGGSVGGLGGGSIGFLAPAIVGGTQGQPIFGAIFGLLGLTMLTAGIVMPRALLRHWARTAITPNEVEAMLDGREAGPERAYLTLLRDALRQEIPDQAATEIRKALRALGEAIHRLPAVPETGETDARQLRENAESAERAASEEPDPVTAASLRRQAEALLRSARAAEQSALVLRRNAVLRREIAVQTEALRLGLAALYAGAGDMAELSRLAEQVRGVAAEAGAVADARAELEEFLTNESTPMAVNPSVETARGGRSPSVAETEGATVASVATVTGRR
ncbi:MAG: hypothetical protein SFU56_16685 [Capsulimonadales bacterium]|nr:hypothetical protein [Capsulimonadales bacterium]